MAIALYKLDHIDWQRQPSRPERSPKALGRIIRKRVTLTITPQNLINEDQAPCYRAGGRGRTRHTSLSLVQKTAIRHGDKYTSSFLSFLGYNFRLLCVWFF